MRVSDIRIGARFRLRDGSLWLRLSRECGQAAFRPGEGKCPSACIEVPGAGVTAVVFTNAGEVHDIVCDTDAFPEDWKP